MGNVMSKDMSKAAVLDHWFVPQEEFPKHYNPPGVEIRRGDLTEWRGVDAIVHQGNCLTVKAHGLSAQIAKKYPWGDAYHYRRPQGFRNLAVPEDQKEPGTIQIMSNPGLDIRKGDRTFTPRKPDVIMLYAQRDFGKGGEGAYQRVPGYEDNPKNREKWFRQCLDKLGTCDYYQTFAFPYKIGCGLAGGNWDHYLPMIEDFTVKYKKHVTLVKKD